jgi:hypothetical protein
MTRGATQNPTMADSPARARATLDDLLDRCEEVRLAALNGERLYTNKHGIEVVVPSPDYRAAIQAVQLEARLLGLLDQADPKDAERGAGEAEQAIVAAMAKRRGGQSTATAA